MREESRKKLSKSQIGNTYRLGTIHTEKTKKKISDSNKISCAGEKKWNVWKKTLNKS